MENQIRLLHADEIECRVSVVKESGVSLLLYKDARVDQRVLDETFGMFGWKRSHQCIDGNLYCTVEIRDPASGEWIAKQDVGTVGYTEKEKSQASDSFKRACFNWGIGRELYTAPFIWVPAADAAIRKDGDRIPILPHVFTWKTFIPGIQKAGGALKTSRMRSSGFTTGTGWDTALACPHSQIIPM